MTFIMEVDFQETTDLIEVLREVVENIENGNTAKKIAMPTCKGRWYFADMGEDE